MASLTEIAGAAAELSIDPGALRQPAAAAFCGISVSTLERKLAALEFPAPARIGRSLVWPVSELRAWLLHGCPTQREWEPIRDRLFRS